VHRRTSARSLMLPTFQVAEGFALPAATASFSLRFTVPLLAAEHFRLVVSIELPVTGSYIGTVFGDPSALDSRRFCSLNHILTFGISGILCLHTVYSVPSSVLNT